MHPHVAGIDPERELDLHCHIIVRLCNRVSLGSGTGLAAPPYGCETRSLWGGLEAWLACQPVGLLQAAQAVAVAAEEAVPSLIGHGFR